MKERKKKREKHTDRLAQRHQEMNEADDDWLTKDGSEGTDY